MTPSLPSDVATLIEHLREKADALEHVSPGLPVAALLRAAADALSQTEREISERVLVRLMDEFDRNYDGYYGEIGVVEVRAWLQTRHVHWTYPAPTSSAAAEGKESRWNFGLSSKVAGRLTRRADT